jgi:predicted RNA-binding Zn-ribbon protein involved in translation (DUF1610 family)
MPTVLCPGCGRRISLPAGEMDLPSITCAACNALFAPREHAEEPKIDFSCPNCHQPYQAPTKRAGWKTNCPRCGQRLQVPNLPPSIGLPRSSRTILAPLLPAPERSADFSSQELTSAKILQPQPEGANLFGVLSLVLAGLSAILLVVPCLWLLAPFLSTTGLILGIIGCFSKSRASAVVGIVLSALILILGIVVYIAVGDKIRL